MKNFPNKTIIVSLLLLLLTPIITQQFSPINLLSNQQLEKRGRAITVKILNNDSWGSGIIVNHQGQVYTVLTNRHVLREDVNLYHIQTPDGVTHIGIKDNLSFNDCDLAILTFKSTNKYETATIGNSDKIREKQPVVASGFPVNFTPEDQQGFRYTVGEISIILTKSLVEGYQIGYTNAIKKGMSGGPVLNSQGKVIAINGMHSYPLWGDPYIYKDGEKPSPEMLANMRVLSWGIPINEFITLCK